MRQINKNVDTWKKDLLIAEDIIYGKNNIIRCKTKQSFSLKFHSEMKKVAALNEFQHLKFLLAYWETRYYQKIVFNCLKNLDRKDSIILDVGCGDGRFTEYLLKLGFKKII